MQVPEAPETGSGKTGHPFTPIAPAGEPMAQIHLSGSLSCPQPFFYINLETFCPCVFFSVLQHDIKIKIRH